MKTRIPLFFLALAVAAAPSTVQAVVYYWDTSTSAGIQNGDGIWGTDSFWTTSGTTLTAWGGKADDARFGGTGVAPLIATPAGNFTVTVTGTQAVATIWQQETSTGSYTLTGGSLNANGIRIDAPSSSMTVNSVLVDNGGSTMSFSARSGTITVTIGGDNTFTQDVIIAGNANGGGKILLNHQNALGLGNKTVTFNHGSNLDLNGFSFSGKDIRVSNNRTGFLVNTGSGNSVWSGNVILDNASPNTAGFRAGGTTGAVEISGVISGFVQNTVQALDDGVLRLSGNNTYEAVTSVRTNSTLIVGHANALGAKSAGTFIGTTATLDLNGFDIGSEEVTLQAASSRLVNNNASSAANVSGNISLLTSGSATREIGGAGNLTLGGVISGDNAGAGFTKVGAGTLTLSGANTYTGGTTVSAGTLALSGSGTLGGSTNALTISGGNVDLGGLSRNVGAFTLSTGTLANGTLTATSYALTNAGSISASLAGSGGLTKSGAGVATLSGSNSYSGTTTISGGLTSFLRMDHANALGSGTTVHYSATSGLDLNGFNVSGKTITVAAGQTAILDNTSATKSVWSGTVDVGSSGSGTLRGGGTGAEVEISGVISGANGMTTHDNGVLRLTGDNTYSGGTSVRENSVLIVGHENALGAKTGTAFIGTTGTLDLNGFDVGSQPITLQQNSSRLVNNNTSTAANVDGAITLIRVGSLRQIGGDGDLTLGGAIGSDANVNGFTKVGTGVLTLAGDNTYTGGTTVSAGSLIVNGSQSAGVLDVSSGATLGGSGTLGGATSISGILAPGAGGIGTLTVANDVTWNGGQSWLFELGTAGASIGSPGTSDLLSITGNNDFLKGTGSSWTFDFAGTGEQGWYRLADWTGGTTTFAPGDFTATNLAGGNTGEFSVQNNALYMQVVPEPGTWTLAMAGLAGAAWSLSWRRRRSA